ncbi:MAG TPA: TerC family protein [Spirochaetota bacterium]|nr:TerC family protein [Spirochaetota bacterium]
MHSNLWWVAFGIMIFILLGLDIAVFNRKSHEIKLKEAVLWSAFWITLALLFNIVVYAFYGHESALQYLTAYLVEKSLSMDNLFVFLMIFSFFKVPHKYQHKVLFWGIIGALVMRLFFIYAGITLINKFHWIIYIFGVMLIYSGIKMVRDKEAEIHPEKNRVLKLFRKFMPTTSQYHGGRFFVRLEGVLHATPLFVVMIVIETSDLIFAVDSIPAVLAISNDTFIVYTSNIMAILGLRALFFALAGVMNIFEFLHYGLSAILVFVGVKMVIADIYKINIFVSLAVIFSILCISIIASVVHDRKKAAEDHKK